MEALKDYPNLSAVLQGCVSGQATEWPRVRSELQRLLDEREMEYRRGFEAGITAYAWWKEGTAYVGTTGKRLADARLEIEKTWNYQP